MKAKLKTEIEEVETIILTLNRLEASELKDLLMGYIDWLDYDVDNNGSTLPMDLYHTLDHALRVVTK